MQSGFDAIPLWLLLPATMAFGLLAIEVGFRAGIHRARRSEIERQAPVDAMVGSTLGLLAFVLAITFGMATSRYDTRRQLVVDDSTAIRSVDLRAQLLPEPQRSEIRTLLREYVDAHIKIALQPEEQSRMLARSEELHVQLWSRIAALGQEPSAAPYLPALTQTLVEMVNLHHKRVNAAITNRLPMTIWIALYCMMGLAMAMTGYRAGLTGGRSMALTFAVVLAFSAVIVLIADLERPQEGLLSISQQSMLDLQAQLQAREP